MTREGYIYLLLTSEPRSVQLDVLTMELES